jgi:hypothetical protein
MTQGMRETAALYEVAGTVTMDRTCVEDAELRSFSLRVRSFIAGLGDDAADPYWKPVVARLRRVRWELATVPLPPAHPVFELAGSAAFLSKRLRGCEQIFPGYAAGGDELVAAVGDLANRDASPLAEAVSMLVQRPGRNVLVLLNGRGAPAVESHLGRPINVTVAVPAELDASLRVYDRAVVVGASSWFPRPVFGAPRAREVCVVQFGWLRDPPMDTSVFASAGGDGEAGRQRLPGYSGELPGTDALTSAELRPVTDWSAIETGTGSRRGAGEDRPDTVDAYLFVLASEQAVYVEAEDGSRAYVVELGASKELQMVPTRSIQPGMYLVVRVGGEGDYIPAMADSLLGAEAVRVRGEQRRWTEALRQLIAGSGVGAVEARLKLSGSARASRGNIRRWASGSSIRTEHYEDFLAIMRVTGLDNEAERLWRDMDLIDQAHRGAGQRVRKLLNREIRNGDTRDLERRGWQDYDVEEIEGEGALRVARVEARDPETVRISARLTRQLLPVERDLWQG